MEVLSSVHIIVENGGKLTLSDSVVQGIIDVQSGGTFSMNYDSFNNEFTTGASLCGQLLSLIHILHKEVTGTKFGMYRCILWLWSSSQGFQKSHY